MDYEQASDFEINKAVGLSIGLKPWDLQIASDDTALIHELGREGVYYGRARFDPCNNPSDAWPIIIENKICIDNSILIDGWRAKHTWKEVGYLDENPLRAVMIVYLMMGEYDGE